MTYRRTSPAVFVALGFCGCAATGAGFDVPGKGPEVPVAGSDVSATGPDVPVVVSEPKVGYDDGFFVRSDDGRAELVIEGLFQTVIGWYGDQRDPETDVTLKRMRPELAGKFDSMRFRLEPKFDDDGVELEEAWAGTTLGANDLLMIGRMKAPFGLEEVRSRRYIDFPNFSILNQFSPAEDLGLFLNGTSESRTWEYNLAAYNGTGSSDTNSSKDVVGRVMVHPFVGDGGSSFENLQLGIAATVGSQDEGVSDGSIEGPSGFDVVRFASGLRLDGDRERVGLEAAWYRGPWMVQGEYLYVQQDMSSGGSDANISFRGGYLDLSRVLTGESKSFKGVKPDVPFDFDTGRGRGAWIVAVRVSRLDIDDDLEDIGGVEPGTFTDGIDGLSLGLNWVPNEHAIVRNALVLSRYDDDVKLDRGSDDKEVAFLVEFQLHF